MQKLKATCPELDLMARRIVEAAEIFQIGPKAIRQKALANLHKTKGLVVRLFAITPSMHFWFP
jgi:hypothetical protein